MVMHALGLTGSIGMGKSTVAKMFVEEGCDHFDADATVHGLYRDPEIVEWVENRFPGTTEKGEVNRDLLRPLVMADKRAMTALEQFIGNKVVDSMLRFKNRGFFLRGIQLFDVPLLFEMDLARYMRSVVVVDCPPEIQKARVMARPGMTEEAFEFIMAKQMPNAEKIAKADYVIDTSKTLEETRDQIKTIITACGVV